MTSDFYPAMRNFKLTLEYDGTDFNGWQIQSQGERTVQGEFQNVLTQVFKRRISVIASGRTDAGVHALGQVINFKVNTRMSPEQIRRAISSFLPSDIVISKIDEVDLAFHAQYSAKTKTYRYTVLNRAYPSPKERNFCCYYPFKLNLTRMRREALRLIGRKEFLSFQASDPKRQVHNTIRRIKMICIRRKGDFITIDIEADGFLYKMVRNIVGTLLQIGSEKSASQNINEILKKKDRSAAGKTVSPSGLCLLQVTY